MERRLDAVSGTRYIATMPMLDDTAVQTSSTRWNTLHHCG